MVPVQHNPEPPLQASPRAVCGPGSHPLAGVQGRVPAAALKAPAAKHGYTCNLTEISHQGQTGGFKVLRYIDRHGHVCAFYDTTLLFPTNAFNLSSSSLGVAVLDMSDPAHPVQTDTLKSLPMLSPHESLSLNTKRGLLAAVLGNPATAPGLVSIYDASQDCRHPVLDSTALVAPFGHEGNFSADGKTFYAAGTAVKSLTAIDVTDPKHPHAIWQGSEYSHGLTLSDNGDRAYVADPIDGELLILDTSQIQARRPHPQAREISRLTWKTATIPQNAIPMTIKGRRYLLEFDEYAFRFNSLAPPDTVGAARIIDITNEQHPRVVSNLRLQVDQPAAHHAADHDPGAIDPAQGYAAHYCNIPREVDPEIAACSFITSGLRVFDIRNPLHPREIGYFVAPPTPRDVNLFDGSNFAMSKPAFDDARREIWYTDGASGFYVLRLAKSLWPDPVGLPRASCPEPTGALAGSRLGPLALCQRRGRVRTALGPVSRRVRGATDAFCFAGGPISAGYAGNRDVVAMTANDYYSLDGVIAGWAASAAVRQAHAQPPIQIGQTTWYLTPGRQAAGVLEARHGIVQRIGIADPRLTRTRAGARRLLSSLG